jgi:hypothetical protein
MSRRAVVMAVAAAVIIVLAAWALTRGLERLMTAPEREAERTESAPVEPGAPVRHITATLFYGSDDGQWLVPAQREVPFGDTPVAQGRHIVQGSSSSRRRLPSSAWCRPGARCGTSTSPSRGMRSSISDPRSSPSIRAGPPRSS